MHLKTSWMFFMCFLIWHEWTYFLYNILLYSHFHFFFFFFQAEDGIRDYKVTGVQTCALPIFLAYAFGYSLLGYDLIMSLSTKWVSNLFGAFYFMGSFLAALMMLAVL